MSFPVTNLFLPVKEMDSCTILSPPRLTLLNKKNSVYFSENQHPLAGNNTDKGRVHITLQNDIKRTDSSIHHNTLNVLTYPNNRGWRIPLIHNILRNKPRLNPCFHFTFFKHLHSQHMNTGLRFLSFAGHRERRKCKSAWGCGYAYIPAYFSQKQGNSSQSSLGFADKIGHIITQYMHNL